MLLGKKKLNCNILGERFKGICQNLKCTHIIQQLFTFRIYSVSLNDEKIQNIIERTKLQDSGNEEPITIE